MAVRQREGRRAPPPYDEKALEQAALAYAGRYATTRARLRAYLERKLRERGWEGEGAPPLERLVERMAALSYVDDRSFAAARAASLSRRGYGQRRIGEALRAAGVGEEDRAEAAGQSDEEAFAAALLFARRRRIGPYAAEAADPAARRKALAALMRAGHSLSVALRIVGAKPGEVPEPDRS